jgi:hypothetical protein
MHEDERHPGSRARLAGCHEWPGEGEQQRRQCGRCPCPSGADSKPFQYRQQRPASQGSDQADDQNRPPPNLEGLGAARHWDLQADPEQRIHDEPDDQGDGDRGDDR